MEKNAMLTRRRRENEGEAARKKKKQMMGARDVLFFFDSASFTYLNPGDAVTFTLVDRELDAAARW